MTELSLAQRSALPPALRVLVEELPRDIWETHPGFSGLIRFWLDRHMLFRQLIDRMQGDAEAALDRQLDPLVYARKLSNLGGALVGELHGHHQIEDIHYFPVLQRLDKRLAPGFDLLDSDHHEIDAGLHRFAETANELLRDPEGNLDFALACGPVRAEIIRLSGTLDRHLEDEEELVVPILLKFAPDGLV